MVILEFIQNNAVLSIVILCICAIVIIEIFHYLAVMVRGYKFEKEHEEENDEEEN